MSLSNSNSIISEGDESLPAYSTAHHGISLPPYSPPIKKFILQTEFSLFKNINQCTWKLIEKGSEVVWYQIYPTNDGRQLQGLDNSILLETKTYQLYPNILVKILKMNQLRAELNYELTVSRLTTYNPYAIEEETGAYTITKRRIGDSNLYQWVISLNESPLVILASFCLSHKELMIAQLVVRSLVSFILNK
ncbi:hypothetical protein K502DRAFT_340810 [Neoconidiobolus thromboides FSU 785]|nr:hypothetical protein K502DRAFT_340810 [Neoconidiobolus thromboides FSU 785]